MSRQIRSRRAGISRDQAKQRPLYARMLGLQYLTPSGWLCFVFLEGAVALGILLALAELVSWWGVLVLPLTVALMVKLNDAVAGAVTRTPVAAPAGVRTQIRQRTGGTPASAEVSRPPTVSFGDSLPAASSPAVRRAAVRPPTMDSGIPPSAVGLHDGVAAAHDSGAVNGPPAARQWLAVSRAEELDATQQRARQTASRRYE
jgi:hypothetical protein